MFISKSRLAYYGKILYNGFVKSEIMGGICVKNYIMRVVLPCLGASLGVTLINFFRNSAWNVGDILSNFAFTFIFTTIIVSVCVGLWTRLKGNRRQKAA